MIRLRDKYKEKSAFIFLEAKSLTPYFSKFKLKSDYFLMFYPGKCKSNSF